METALIRIAGQAEYLARTARAMEALYRRRKDGVPVPPSAAELAAAVGDMRAAFMAVLRTIAEYL